MTDRYGCRCHHCRKTLVSVSSRHASYPYSCSLCDSGSGEHLGTGRRVREEGQHHQPHLLHQCPLHTTWFRSVVPWCIRRWLRFTTGWHQPWNREDGIWDHQQTAGHEGSPLRFWQLYLCPFQRESCQCVGPRPKWWVAATSLLWREIFGSLKCRRNRYLYATSLCKVRRNQV